MTGDILTGQAAIEHMVDRWQEITMGMVGLETDLPWFIVDRAGGDYRTFLSLADGTAVTVLDSDATPDDIPDDLRPDGSVDDGVVGMLERAFSNQGGGSYPLPDEGVFAVAFREAEQRRSLRVGLLDDAVGVVDE